MAGAEIGALWAFVKNECEKARRAMPSGSAFVPLPSPMLDDPFADILANLRGNPSDGEAA